MIELQNVQIKYDDFIAVDQVNLKINKGEFFTFLGPSGCGKTTTLRAIAGLTQPSQGKIFINGQDITPLPAEKRKIGMVFQSYALFPTMTVFDNIAYGLRVDRLPEKTIQEKVYQQAAIVELSPEDLVKNVSQLSGGQQQRVAIARTLIKEPQLILFDEPLSNLDAKLRQQLRLELKQIQAKTNLTAIYVTHDQEEALELSDRIAVFNQGHIEQIADPIELYNHSANEFVCNFIGRVNQLESETMEHLNQDNSYQLDSQKKTYIRYEALHDQRQSNEDILISGTICHRSFHGSQFLYGIKVKNQVIYFITLNQQEPHYQMGDSIQIYFNTKQLLTYAKEEE